MDTILGVVQATGAIATAVSVIWAICAYKRGREEQDFLLIGDEISNVKGVVTQLDESLSEPEFSVVGHGIAESLRSVKPASWSREQFTEYLGGKANHDAIAQAIHLGRMQCDVLSKQKSLLTHLRHCHTHYTEGGHSTLFKK